MFKRAFSEEQRTIEQKESGVKGLSLDVVVPLLHLATVILVILTTIGISMILGKTGIVPLIFVSLQWVLLFFVLEGGVLVFLSIFLYFFNKRHLAKKTIARGFILLVISFMGYVVVDFINTPLEKPVIYLYPTEPTDVKVQLDVDGEIIADYPQYDESIKGWEVKAYSDGHLVNKADGKEYSYLFWEGRPGIYIKWDLEEGFVVKGEDTREFLQKTLSQIGLTPKEYNEFIVYWYPLLKDNPYNLIHFAQEQYTDYAKLKIDPEPDSVLRVFMVYKPLRKEIKIKPQAFESFERDGFTVVEWGGTKAR